MAVDQLTPDVLVVNAGSGSLKLDMVDGSGDITLTRDIDGAPSGEQARAALDQTLSQHPEISLVGYRVVHGGPRLLEPVYVDDQVIAELTSVIPLAPTHLPPILEAIRTCRDRLPGARHVACFDTAFHAGMPEAALTYALPREWRDLGIRRYGFHGTSYAWATRRAAALLGRPVEAVQLVLAHLGGGASVCAVNGGRSMWTSMGFTPLEGLAMVKRSGSIDPGILLWLQQEQGLSADQIGIGLQHRSGLLGLTSGRTGDTRDIVRWAEHDAEAALALDVYTLRIRQEIAAAAASLTRLDALVYTGEIGCDQPEVRAAVCAGLPVLGLPAAIDARQDGDRVLTQGRPAVLLVQTGEAQEIAHRVRLLAQTGQVDLAASRLDSD